MKPADKRLWVIGNQIEVKFKEHGFGCIASRAWNDEYEFILTKAGGFDVVQQEIISLLESSGFKRTTHVAGKEVIVSGPYLECEGFYANFDENIGCRILKNSHNVLMFSNLIETFMRPIRGS